MQRLKLELERLMAYTQARIAHRHVPVPQISGMRTVVLMRSTAWQTASATQALLHLPFAEAGALSQAYYRQTRFNELQDRAEQNWFELAAYNQADLDDDQFRPALQKLTIAYASLSSIQIFERGLVDDYDKALAAMPR